MFVLGYWEQYRVCMCMLNCGGKQINKAWLTDGYEVGDKGSVWYVQSLGGNMEASVLFASPRWSIIKLQEMSKMKTI